MEEVIFSVPFCSLTDGFINSFCLLLVYGPTSASSSIAFSMKKTSYLQPSLEHCVLNSQKRLLDVYIGILLFRSQQRFESRPSYSFYDSKLEHLSGLVRPVVGSNGSLMGRWRTFHLVIACRSISLYPWILGHFYGEVPNLQSLEIENVSGDSHRNYLNDGYFASDNRQSLFSNMPNVRYVRVPIELSLEALSVSPRKLEHLYIVYTGCLQGLEQISRFSLLSELHIGCDSDTRDDPNHLVAYAMTISLPSLLLLTLSWEVELISHITFDVPNLRKWEFRSSRYDLQQYSQLGKIVSPLVEWYVDDYAVVEGEEWDEDDNSVGPSIRHLLKTIMSAESLKIFAKVTLDWADVALVIGEARRDNEIPPMIQSIEIHAKNSYRTWQPGMY
ncbi:hypothetical protein FRB91_002418 [Serendipita sp. 411]|nr:hypothetical protein FRC18_010814 [Serendipita sp. 400]KAG8844670.1 hypothetical protein FRB91_002418 [Serendipita sp. 411]